MNKTVKFSSLLVLVTVLLFGCRSGLFNTEPFVDGHYNESGEFVMEDTPKNWQIYALSVDSSVLNEREGIKPEAQRPTWNDYWLWRIESLPENIENREKYINYIIERRRQEALPELKK